MYVNQRRKKPAYKNETIFETEHRLKQVAKELAENHKSTKPIKYLLK